MGVGNGSYENKKNNITISEQNNKNIIIESKNSLAPSHQSSSFCSLSQDDSPIIVIRVDGNTKTKNKIPDNNFQEEEEQTNRTSLIILKIPPIVSKDDNIPENNLDETFVVSPIEDEANDLNKKEFKENQEVKDTKNEMKGEQNNDRPKSPKEKTKNLRILINTYKKDKRKMDENLILTILREICLDLKRANKEKIVFLDIKPDNIIINDEFNITIGDSSLSTNNFKYSAPEILKPNNNHIDKDKAVIWSVGCILYELCKQKSCFKYTKNKMKYYEILKKKKIKLNNEYKNLNKLLKNLLVIDVNDRYNIEELTKDVKELYSKLKKPENLNDLDELSKNILKKFDKNQTEIIIDTSIKTKTDMKKEIDFFEINNDQMRINNLEFSEIYIDAEKKEKQDKYILGNEGKHKVLLEFDEKNVKCSKLFYNCDQIIDINLYLFNTSMIKDMSSMFSYCKNLKKLDLSPLNTLNVENISRMFCFCENLEELDLSTLDTQKVNNMESVFDNCMKLKKINLNSINTKNVNNMKKMFNNCINLNYLNLLSFDTSNVTNMDSMFMDCKSLVKLDLSNFNTTKVELFNDMFKNCENLKFLDISYFNTEKATHSITNLFANCNKLQKIILNNKEKEKKINILSNSKIRCNIIELKLTLAYKYFIDLFIYIFQLEDKGDSVDKKRSIERFLLKNKYPHTNKISQLFEDLSEFIDNYDFDQFNIDFDENIINQIIWNIGKYKGNGEYQEIIELMKEYEIDDLFKQLIKVREDKFKEGFKEQEKIIIKEIRQKCNSKIIDFKK